MALAEFIENNFFLNINSHILLEMYKSIVAVEYNGGIGYQGKIPWKSSVDMKHFKATTIGDGTKLNIIIMGRVTYESLKRDYLPERLNVVVSNTISPNIIILENGKIRHGVITIKNVMDLEDYLMQPIYNATEYGDRFIIGGEQLYNTVNIEQIYLTRIYTSVECDRFYKLPEQATLISSEFVGLTCEHSVAFEVYSMHPEYQYLNLVKKILNTSNEKDNRTNVKTIGTIGEKLEFDLDYGFPLLTTKKMFWKGVVLELLWFIKGCTNSKELEKDGVNIWKGNASSEFLKSRGLPYDEGELGPIYGYQWRHSGASEQNLEGVDQLKQCIHLIKNEPHSRRIIMTAWNPVDIPKMALPPCHILSQFLVDDGRLNCIMYQRSGDVGLGIPFNIASYSLLLCILADHCGLKRGKFTHFIGDAHIYVNHIDALRGQLDRTPKLFPTLKPVKIEDIDKLCYDDIVLEGYKSHGTIKMDMVV